MTRDLAPLAERDWDLVVIGGGITGAAVLLEAARAGLTALLVEQRDFAWGASSRSGKWVHGGLRYMQQGQVHVTWASVREREKLARDLPELVRMTPMLLPLSGRKRHEGLVTRLGLALYDLMAGRWRHRWLDRHTIAKRFPHLRIAGLRGGYLFWEGQTDDARLTLRVLDEARRLGGTAVNYCEAVGLVRDEVGLVTGVEARDADGGPTVRLRARQVIAATGAWSDQLRGHIANRSPEKLRPLRGSHLVFDRARLPIDGTVVLNHPRDGRPGFVTVFEGRAMLGNTDLDHRQDLRRDASITPEEVDYLLETLRFHFPDLHLGREDIIATFSGVRPVVDSGQDDPSRESRDHIVWHEDGLITIGGGKLTTFQHIALDALKRAQARFPGARFAAARPVIAPAGGEARFPPAITPEQAARLRARYGARVGEVLTVAEPADMAIIPGTETFWFELAWCAGAEEVRHLDDLLLRRVRIGLLLRDGGAGHMDRIRALVQARLGLSDDDWALEEAQYRALWRAHYGVPA